MAKLCFPGRNARDYNRYAGALSHAQFKQWTSEEFLKELANPGSGGMTEMAREETERRKAHSVQEKELLGADDALLSRYRNTKGIASFAASHGKVGIVLLVGERASSGEVTVYEILESKNDRRYAERSLSRKDKAGRSGSVKTEP